ncbi:MAG: hypothetical protein V4682_03410 [Patescibacteria group bacterium]
MLYLILIGLSLILFGGFIALTAFERRRGLRVAGIYRNKLDAKVSRAAFIATHVDWGAFTKHLLGTVLERVLHDVAHFVLRIVRTTERLLTRTVKALRERRGITVPLETEGEEKPGILQTSAHRVRVALRNARAASRKPARRKPEPEA